VGTATDPCDSELTRSRGPQQWARAVQGRTRAVEAHAVRAAQQQSRTARGQQRYGVASLAMARGRGGAMQGCDNEVLNTARIAAVRPTARRGAHYFLPMCVHYLFDKMS
jgi:hypothetical protein